MSACICIQLFKNRFSWSKVNTGTERNFEHSHKKEQRARKVVTTNIAEQIGEGGGGARAPPIFLNFYRVSMKKCHMPPQ